MSEQKEILIVDDAAENVIFMAQVLEDHGFRFRVARNGKEALTALRDKQPDLVLLDIMMPRKSGINVYKEMKGEPSLAEIPVIIVTGASEVTGVSIKTGEKSPPETYGDDLARGLGSSVYDRLKDLTPEGLLEKPLEPQLLIETIKELL